MHAHIETAHTAPNPCTAPLPASTYRAPGPLLHVHTVTHPAVCTSTLAHTPMNTYITHVHSDMHTALHMHSGTSTSLQIHIHTHRVLTGRFSGSIGTKANFWSPGPPLPPTPRGFTIHYAPHSPTSSCSSSSPATGGSRGLTPVPVHLWRWDIERRGERMRWSTGGNCLPFGCFPVYYWLDFQLPQQPPERSPGQPGTGESLQSHHSRGGRGAAESADQQVGSLGLLHLLLPGHLTKRLQRSWDITLS